MNFSEMDPNVQNVLLGVIGNGLWALIAKGGQKAREAILGKPVVENAKSLQSLLKKSINHLAETIEWQGPSRLEEICLFLCSPDVEQLVRQLFSTKIIDVAQAPEISLNIHEIRSEFLSAFSYFVGIQEDKLKHSSDLLFDALVKTCDATLQKCIESGVLVAHEARSEFRFRILRDEILTIKKNLAFLTSGNRLNHGAICKFEEKFRNQVAQRHKYLIPPHIDSAKKVSIDSLFVSPNFNSTTQGKQGEVRNLNTVEFLAEAYRVVILGNPGGGKSTFSAKICHELASGYNTRIFAGRQVTPILVVLRDYGAAKKRQSISILQFIEAEANSKYQVKPPPGAFEYMLLNGRSVVLFDGLDELLDTSYRQEITADIELFCNLYPSVPVLVTSREVGYEQAPLDGSQFDVFRLSPFDEAQVKEYVHKWFNTDTNLETAQRKEKAESFFAESQIVPDLRSNPLMLGLMCSIYRGENYIPKNRPDVYAKCALMLFERWDKSRGIHVVLPFEDHIRPAMMHLAFWIYGDESLQGGVTEEKLISNATDYLCSRRFEDRDEAASAARKFIEFCRGRAWVFTDTGTTKEGQRLFQFTHRTFLEFFAASNLVRTNPTPELLSKVLLPRIAKREWDVVAQLAFQLMNRNVETACDELLSTLIDESIKSRDQTMWNLLSFASRCLEFMVPNPKLTRLITKTCFERYIDWGTEKVRADGSKKKQGSADFNPEQLLHALLTVATENRPIVANETEIVLIREAKQPDETRRCLALELGLHLNLGLFRSSRSHREPAQDCRQFWENTSTRIGNACEDVIIKLCPRNFRICFDAVFLGSVSIGQFVNWHGIFSLFKQCRYTLFPGTFSWSVAETSALWVCIVNKTDMSNQRFTNALKRVVGIGKEFLKSDLPIINKSDKLSELRIVHSSSYIQNSKITYKPQGDVLFGIFCVFALISELASGDKKKAAAVKNCNRKLLGRFSVVFDSRDDATLLKQAENILSKYGFDQKEHEFALKWIRKQNSFVESAVLKNVQEQLEIVG